MKDQLLPTFEPTESDLTERAMSLPLDEKIRIAVKTLQAFEAQALALSPDGYYVCDSYGKDSDCIVELAKMAGVKHTCNHSVTSLDPPELMRFGALERPDTIRHRQPRTLLTEMVENDGCKGPPMRMARWCCEKYKEGGGNGTARMIGVRAAESPRRKAMWKTIITTKDNGVIVCPIVYWTDEDVWEFHHQRNLPYCELYDQGFNRLGCIGCPLAGSKQQRIEFDKWPRYEMLWKRAFERFWNKWHGVPTIRGKRRWFEDFGSWQGLWEWWITKGEQDSRNDGCQMEFLYAAQDTPPPDP